MLFFSIIILNCEDHVLFVLIHLTGVLCPLLKFFSSCQASCHFSTGVLLEIILLSSLFISTRVFSFPSCPLRLSFLPLQSQGFRNVVCSSFSNGVFFNFVHLRGIPPFFLFNLARFFGFTHWSKEQLSLPLRFLFRFPSGSILDLGTRSSRSGGVL